MTDDDALQFADFGAAIQCSHIIKESHGDITFDGLMFSAAIFAWSMS